MTATIESALEYFERAQKQRRIDPVIEEAMAVFEKFYKRMESMGFDSAYTGANFAAFTWFRAWDRNGRKSGIPGFVKGLRRCFRWSCVKLEPKSSKIIQGITEDGKPSMERPKERPKGYKGRYVPGMAPIPHAEATAWVRRWNAESKAAGELYRYAVATGRHLPPGFARMRRYKLVRLFPGEAAAVSFDALSEDKFAPEYEAGGYGDFLSARDEWDAWDAQNGLN